MNRILVVDDDQKLLKMLQRTLVLEGFDVDTAGNGLEALERIDQQAPDILIADWTMPKMDGMELVRQLRQEKNQLPVLLLTARDAIENRVQGLQTGADDYLIKPFAPAELVARVRALLRRSESANPTAAGNNLQCADVVVDLADHRVMRAGHELPLTLTEFNLLHTLMRNKNHVVERASLLNEVWGYDFGGDDNVLEIYIGYLRKKLENGGHTRLIHTIRGVGYSLREPKEDQR